MTEPADPIERKVQFPGNSTFSISLPKSWALEHDLEPGSTMYLYAHPDRLVVGPKPLDGDERTTSIELAGVDADVLARRIRGAYAAGCDRIELVDERGIDDDVDRFVRRTVGELVGVAVHREDDATIVATAALDPGDVSLPQTVAQLERLALEMHEDAIAALVADDETLARRVGDRDDEVDRLFAFVTRGFHRGLEDVHEIHRLGIDRPAAFHSYRTARQLERIADHAATIASVVEDQSGAPEPPLADGLETLGTGVRAVVDLAFSGDVEAALSRCETVRTEEALLRNHLSDRHRSDGHVYGAALENALRSAECGLAIVDATIERTARTTERVDR